MSTNFYDPPYRTMIHSGQFWRCKHGHTRFRDMPGCGWCVIKRPSRWLSFVGKRIAAWWAQ